MPLTKRQNGWYWGSKGPFKSKAKALSVARAAYASGYKEDQKSATGSSGEPVDQGKKLDEALEKMFGLMCGR
jgi:hypothetical protein